MGRPSPAPKGEGPGAPWGFFRTKDNRGSFASSAIADFAQDDTPNCELKCPLEAEDVDGCSPDRVGALKAVGGPLVGLVEALGAEVVNEREEVGVLEAERDDMGACGGDECHADAESP